MSKKTTKRALAMSFVSVFLCVCMLVGTTFAWFTDSASTGVNTIQSGTLKVDLEDAAGNSVVGQALSFVKAAGAPSGEAILWEPGCTYELTPVYVHNEGSLALKYQIVINGIDGDAELLDAIEWSVKVGGTETDLATFEETLNAGAKSSNAIVLVGHMKEDAGNEYQGLSIEGVSITVVATQATEESDSFGDQYDKDAEYPDFVVSTQADLAAAIAEGGTIQLSDDIEIKNVGSNASAFVIAGGKEVTLDLNGKTIYSDDNFIGMALFENKYGAKLTITGNGTIEMKPKAGNAAVMFVPRGELIIENGTFKIPYVLGNDADPEGNTSVSALFAGINVKDPTNNSASVIVYDGYFDGGYWRTDKFVPYNAYGKAGPDTLINLSVGETFTVYGGTFVGYNPAWGDEACTAYYKTVNSSAASREGQGVFLKGQEIDDTVLPAGYTITEDVTTDGTGRPTYTVDYAITDDKAFDEAVAAGTGYVPLAAGTYSSNFKVAGGSNLVIEGVGAETVLNGQIATTASDEGTLVLRNLTINVSDAIKDSTSISQTGKSAIAIWGDQTVICENVTFDMSLADSTAITSWWDTGVGTTIICKNCTFNCNGQRPIRATGNVTVENCTFNDPYRYAVQLTAKASTAIEMDKAIINFNNNTIVDGANGKTFVYGIQLEGSEYGCNNCVINGAGNTIENGGAGSTMYYCECGKVDHATITWNTEVAAVHEVTP